MQDQVALAERAAFRVLPGEADRGTLGQKRCKSQGFRVRPFDLPAAFGERRAPPLQLLHQLGNDGKAAGHGE